MAHTNLNFLNNAELQAAISDRLKATERSGESLISYAVLGILANDGDMTVNEFIAQFIGDKVEKPTSKSAAKQAAFEEDKRKRNRASQYFRCAKMIANAHETALKKALFALNDLSTQSAGDCVSRWLWKATNPTARYRNEHHVMVALKKVSTPRDADELVDSYVNAVVKKFGTLVLKDDQADKIIEAVSLALARGVAEEETQEAPADAETQAQAA